MTATFRLPSSLPGAKVPSEPPLAADRLIAASVGSGGSGKSKGSVLWFSVRTFCRFNSAFLLFASPLASSPILHRPLNCPSLSSLVRLLVAPSWSWANGRYIVSRAVADAACTRRLVVPTTTIPLTKTPSDSVEKDSPCRQQQTLIIWLFAHGWYFSPKTVQVYRKPLSHPSRCG